MTAEPLPPRVGIYVRLQHRFGPRILEWFIASVTLAWGAVLLLPSPTFAGPAWAVLAALLPEEAWGVLIFGLGLTRLGGLFVNGALPRVTPWIRMVAAGVGFLLWVGICFGFALTGIVSTWIAVYPSFAVAELVNIYRASHDAGESNGAA